MRLQYLNIHDNTLPTFPTNALAICEPSETAGHLQTKPGADPLVAIFTVDDGEELLATSA